MINTPFAYSYYNFIKLNNIIWTVNLNTFKSTNNDLFSIMSMFFIFENMQISLIG